MRDPGTQTGRLGHRHEPVLVSARGEQVSASTGPALSGTVTAAETARIDTLAVAGGDRLAERPVEERLLAAARAVAARATRVASVCTGAFALAEPVQGDGRRATTHCRRADTLARRHPRVRAEPDTIHVRDGRFVTSAGVSAGIDRTPALA
ncbi:DJ-1/PfpI family protein [Streptomyces sp. P1-3]|uniref:DJ-1/PfpI family protein n=1 Tax=Streptomyces sp. P1-3 TaxID=3421658 RepID=UPI003D36B2A5